MSKGRPNRAFAIVAATITLVFAGANMVSPLWPLYRTALHLTNVELTTVFAAYTLGALVALFGFGGLSDVIGRRPLLIAAVIGTIASALLFAFATNIVWLLAARLVQGLAVGAVSASANAALNDFAIREDPRHAAVVGSIASSVGFAVGPFSAGVLADIAPAPLQTTFFALTVCAAIILALLIPLPNPGRRAGAIYTGNRAGVPASIRSSFIRAAAAFTVGWVSGPLFLALGPSIILALLGTASHTVAGAMLLVFFGAAGIGQFIARALSARNTLRIAVAAVAAGLLLAAGATVTHSLALFFVAITLTGASQGIALLGGLAVINTIAPPEQRAGVLSAFFFCGYLGVTIISPLLGWVADAAGLNIATISFALTLTTAAAIVFTDLTRWPGPPQSA